MNIYNNLSHYTLDIIALAVFILCWVYFVYYTKRSHKNNTSSLTYMLNFYRDTWMYELLNHSNRVSDVQLLAIFERNCLFFASSSLLIVAGLMTFAGSLDKATDISAYFFIAVETDLLIYKVLILLALFVHSFFSFTWANRQFGFVGFMIVSAPMPKNKGYTKKQRKKFAYHTSTLADLAANSFHAGLRNYYYSLAIFSWIISPIALIISSIAISAILYRREFYSNTLSTLQMAYNDLADPDIAGDEEKTEEITVEINKDRRDIG